VHKSLPLMIKKLAETAFTTYLGVLKCGNLSARIGLYPAPQTYVKTSASETITKVFSDSLEVCGFIEIADLASPMAISRHLVTPLPVKSEAKTKLETEGDEETDEGKIPSFCVLFHGALKVENVAALCSVGDDWYGILYSWADNKKKSNLMLAVFEPGSSVVPWLGDFNYVSGENLPRLFFDMIPTYLLGEIGNIIRNEIYATKTKSNSL